MAGLSSGRCLICCLVRARTVVTVVLEAHIHWLHTITIRQTDKLKQSSLLEMAF
jgi:hypothetical protein